MYLGSGYALRDIAEAVSPGRRLVRDRIDRVMWLASRAHAFEFLIWVVMSILG
jgi:hypothetical protein